MKFFLRKRGASAAALLALVTSIAGCGDDETQKPGGSGGTPPAPRLSGELRYEFVPYDHTNDGLDYGKTEARPIRGARVVLLDASDSTQIKETTSDEQGHYALDWEGTSQVKIWVYAETVEPPIVVEDNTSGNATYVVESGEALAETKGGAKLDVLATTGWTGSSYAKPRLSAPFSVLDAVYTAASRFMKEATPAPAFKRLKVNWSVDNRPESGSVSAGQIDTSNWDGTEIYLLGKENVDTDEFDTHVLVHEWGHSFEQFIARSDSQGGSHGYGDVLDPRLAFSEGLCNALSAIILEPDTVYADSSGTQQKDGFWFDLEANDTTSAASPGWYSEQSVQDIVFDVYDTANEPFDKVSFGLQGVYGVLTGGFKQTPALTTIFPFVSTLKAANASQVSVIDELVVHHAAGGTFGIDVVTDDWGTGESHSADEPAAIPVYVKAKPGDTFEVTLTGGLDYALLGQNRFVRIAGTGSTVKVTSTSANDVDLYVYLRGNEITNASSASGNETVSFSTKQGEEYVVNIQGYGELAGPYTAKIGVSP